MLIKFLIIIIVILLVICCYLSLKTIKLKASTTYRSSIESEVEILLGEELIFDKNKKANENDEFIKYMQPNRVNELPISLPVVPLDWLGTIFDRYEKHHYIVNIMASATVMDVHAIKDLGYCSLFAYCDLVDISQQRARLRISDPYSTIWTQYFKLNAKNDASLISDFNGRMVRVLGYTENGKIKVDRVIKTRFRKYMH